MRGRHTGGRAGLARSAGALALLCALALPARADDQTITLGVGTQKVIQVPGVQRVAVGDSEIADVKVLGNNNEILVIGVAEGRTTLLVWRSGGDRTHPRAHA